MRKSRFIIRYHRLEYTQLRRTHYAHREEEVVVPSWAEEPNLEEEVVASWRVGERWRREIRLNRAIPVLRRIQS